VILYSNNFECLFDSKAMKINILEYPLCQEFA
jgi:hypothetical protein